MKNITLYLLLLAAFSCKVGERPYRQVATDTHVDQHKKDIISPWISRHFPPQTIYTPGKKDTVVKVVTDQQEIDNLTGIINTLLDEAWSNDTTKQHRIDSLASKLRAAIGPCKGKETTITIRDTVKTNDPAEIDGWRKTVFDLQATNAELRASENKAILARKAAFKYLYITGGVLLALLLALGVWLYFKLKGR